MLVIDSHSFMQTDQPKASLPRQLDELLLVGIGAIPGALIRWKAADIYFGGGENVLVNIAGAFLLGLIVGLGVNSRVMLLVGIGFCGALTTFSAWMVDCVMLISQGDWQAAIGLIALTLCLGFAAAAFGNILGKRLRLLSREADQN